MILSLELGICKSSGDKKEMPDEIGHKLTGIGHTKRINSLIHILFWCLSKFILKAFGKIGMVGKAHKVHHFRNRKFLLAK